MVAPLSDRWWIINAELWVTGTPNQPHRTKIRETAGSSWKVVMYLMNNMNFVSITVDRVYLYIFYIYIKSIMKATI